MNETIKLNKKDKFLFNCLPYAIFAVVILLILSYQIRTHTAIFVSDSYFHFSRFYDAAQQIKTHNFSYFQTNWGFDQSGRIINALYGPYFAYFMGALLLVCGTWLRFQLLSTFLISFIAVIGIYKCLKLVSSNLISNIIISLIYLTSINLWSNGSTFNSISSAMIPYVLYCGLKMLIDRERPINWLQLGLTISVVGQVHVLSTILSIVLLIPFFVIGLLKTNNKKEMLVNFGLAVILTLVLTVNIWTVLFYFHSAEIVSNPVAQNMVKATVSIRRLTVLSILLILMQFIYIAFHFKESKLNTIVTLMAFAFLILATKLFPWGIVQSIFPVLKEAFQMPRRFIILVIPLYLVGVSVTVTQIHIRKILIIIYSFLLLVFLSNYSRVTRINNFYTVNSLMTGTSVNRAQRLAASNKNLSILFKNLNVPAPDYLPQPSYQISDKQKVKLYSKEVINNKKSFSHHVLSHGELRLTWKTKLTKHIILPIVMYKNSKLTLNGKVLSGIRLTPIGAPIVKEKRGNNQVILSYQAPRWWFPVLLINLISWCMIIILVVWRKLKLVIINE